MKVDYGVALASRIDTIICLFCKRDLYKRLYSAKETYKRDYILQKRPIRCIIDYHTLHQDVYSNFFIHYTKIFIHYSKICILIFS